MQSTDTPDQTIDALGLAKRLSELAVDKKARHPILLDVGKLTSYTDYILIVTATSDRHSRALADHLTRSARDFGTHAIGTEGYETGQWILLDFGEVIVHVLQELARDYYDLDSLWLDAKRLPLEQV